MCAPPFHLRRFNKLSVVATTILLLTFTFRILMLNYRTVELSETEKRLYSIEDQLNKMIESTEHNFIRYKTQEISSGSEKSDKTAVLVMACNRPAISRCLHKIFEYIDLEKYAVIVSQDCGDEATEKEIQKFQNKLVHIKQPDRSDPVVPTGHQSYINYYKISRHYKWAIGMVLDVLLFDQVIIIEDDLEISPDFFDYFTTFLPILKLDKSLYCISAWNDNGKTELSHDTTAVIRNDLFPGLGWMLTRDLWLEFKPKWPGAFWDDWLREPEQRKQRSCISPEVSRVYNFGKIGVSQGQYYDEHIGSNIYSQEKTKFPLSAYYYHKQNYDDLFLKRVYEYSHLITTEQLKQLLKSSSPTFDEAYKANENAILSNSNEKLLTYPASPFYCGKGCLRRYRIEYDSSIKEWKDFEKIGEEWNIMTDIRANLARTSYLGIVCWKSAFKYPPVFRFKNVIDDEWRVLAGQEETHVSVCLSPMRVELTSKAIKS